MRYDKVQGNRFRHGTRLIRFRDDKDPRRTARGVEVPSPRAATRTTRRSSRCSASFFLAREGCTRFGSPGIFGKFGGYGASADALLLVALDPLEQHAQVVDGVVDLRLHVAELGEAAPASSRS